MYSKGILKNYHKKVPFLYYFACIIGLFLIEYFCCVMDRCLRRCKVMAKCEICDIESALTVARSAGVLIKLGNLMLKKSKSTITVLLDQFTFAQDVCVQVTLLAPSK